MAYANPTSVLLAMFATFFLLMFLISIASYIYGAIVLMTVAKKTKTKNGWLAWIPIANVYLMTQIAKVPGWVTLAFLLVLIPFVGLILFLACYIWLWWKIAEARHKPGWIALFMIIPIVSPVIMGLIAWKDK